LYKSAPNMANAHPKPFKNAPKATL
jgi:hypothetical protein